MKWILKVTIILKLVCIISSFRYNSKLLTSENYKKSFSQLQAKLIVGLSKYSHDASCAILDASNGKLLFNQAKERVTSHKHEGGSTGELLDYAMEYLKADISDIEVVVSNNHIHRVIPYENRLPFYKSLNYITDDYITNSNLLKHAKHYELSHHLAHAWSAIGTAPFKKGLILVMDGMGETFRAMSEDESNNYYHDLKLLKSTDKLNKERFVGIPKYLKLGSSYREGETAYYYDGYTITPVYKRWSKENTTFDSDLYNYGFEFHESIGAIYSRISSYLLGDWNACGKVMGLAPWANKNKDDAKKWYFDKNKSKNGFNELELGQNFYHSYDFMSGNSFNEENFHINWNLIENLENPNQFNNKRFGYLANIASSIQNNLEKVSLELIKSLKEQVATDNFILTGGVALNSVLNGRIQSEIGFKNVHIPPAPGDEGIAYGCALYGYQVNLSLIYSLLLIN